MPESSEVIDSNAYLVIRQDGKWTDMFRLQPGTPIIIGRSSRSQIVVRSDQASRAHAEVAWQGGRWLIRDLGSRNGTVVNNATIRGEQALKERDIIAVAGHQMTFVTRLAAAFTAPDQDPTHRGVASGDDDGSPTQEQIDPTLITHRRGRSTILDPNEIAIAASHEISLLRTAFALARSDSPEKAADIALDAITAVTHVSSGAVLLLQQPRELSASKATTPKPALGNITALAARSHQGHSYRRLSDKIVRTVLESGEAVLARNLQDDVTLTSPDSQGELSTSSTLCAPIRVDQKVAGLLHIYSRGDEPELQSDHLEWALAIAAHLGLTLEQLWRERSLRSNLRKSQEQLTQLRQQLGESVTIVGESPAILEIQRQVARAAPTSATVLVRGESGVGKELIAAAIHYASSRRNGPFVCLNCAALSPSLLESELFGHEKGAFTGATERKIGKFEAADGGTLMLDEI
ncbi:MAG: sigma 54-interacting transcriptional regulator, partial [Planctomycetaceae bacterium]|nr:sigma 54-interacting transcriptional regulator [Planctomycetaceae bacterium]